MTFTIDIVDQVGVDDGLEGLLKTAVVTTLRQQKMDAALSLTLLLTDNETIQQLNRDYRGQNKPTDVLSFPSGDEWPDIEEMGVYLGDIAIAVPVAEQQAVLSGHALAAELQLLAVHGTLHLLGHDHLEVDEKTAMWAAQTAVMQELGLENITPTET